MSSRLAMLLALVLLGGAAVAGYFAWTLSQPQEPAVVVKEDDGDPEAAESDEAEQALFEVVFAGQSLEAGDIIRADQLVVHALPVDPPDTYKSPDALAGKRVWRNIRQGEMIRPGHLRRGSELATTLLPQERAIAISVDEVIGTGGFLAPGDSVDVLLYLREARKGGFPSAQLVLEEVRLLSFAERVQPPPGSAAAEESERTEFRGKTAVLAVPREDVTRLMLASSAGSLRLALHSAERPDRVLRADFRVTDRLVTDPAAIGPAETGARQLVELDEFFPERPEPPPARPRQAPPEPAGTTIPIHRGGSTETVEVPPREQ